MAFRNGGECRADRIRIGHVTCHRKRRSAQFIGDCLDFRERAAKQDDRLSIPGKAAREGTAKANSRAGNDDRLAH
jgi:hypothetical protein